jgi:hypothetical protein
VRSRRVEEARRPLLTRIESLRLGSLPEELVSRVREQVTLVRRFGTFQLLLSRLVVDRQRAPSSCSDTPLFFFFLPPSEQSPSFSNTARRSCRAPVTSLEGDLDGLLDLREWEEAGERVRKREKKKGSAHSIYLLGRRLPRSKAHGGNEFAIGDCM